MHRKLQSMAVASLCAMWIVLGASAARAQEIEAFLPSASAPCAGELEKRHRSDPPWDFTTNSRKPTAQQPTVFLHCIFNNDPKNLIEVDWLIPKVKEPVAAKTSAISPRYSDKPPEGQPDGCLIFGNLHDKALKAQFWARSEDGTRVSEETGKDCLTLKTTDARTEIGPTQKLSEIVAPFRIFLSSNPSSPSSSVAALIAFEGITGVRTSDSHSYQSFVTYRLRTEDGIPPSELDGAYAIAPRWVGPLELLARCRPECGWNSVWRVLR